ncbi:hypothetical protein [Streptomyces sp. NBC_01546]|uniref:hypothetical protein n=1 Tax=Streptomyces sp. NBC_01546 TaxID=2975872 RepID=UPI003865F960
MSRDLFAPIVTDKQAHHLFQRVRTGAPHAAARRLMNEVFADFHDVDKSFVREFQTGGFSARVFELALFAYLREQGLIPDRSHAAPDFAVLGDTPVAIEVTTTNPAQGGEPDDLEYAPLLHEDLPDADKAFVFQLGKALRRKLTHRDASCRAYWEKGHIRDVPFVIAVGAFHNQNAQMHVVGTVAEYLYGQRDVLTHDTTGKLTITADKVERHESGGKSIPSGLFQMPEAANLAGVLFSNAHTMGMFNRIGTESGYGPDDVAICRVGTAYNPDPNASEPRPFAYVVGDRPPGEQETFAEGLHLFINPWANRKLSPQALPGIPFANFTDGRLVTMVPNSFQPFTSKTFVVEHPQAQQIARYQQLLFLGKLPNEGTER